eukprot:8162339-Pyramimonas_sp.AAC.1
MAVEVVPGPPRAPPPPLEDGPGAADPPPGDDSDPLLDNNVEGQERQLVNARTVGEVADIEPLLRLGLSKKSLKRMARACGVLKFETMRAHMLGGPGPIPEKKEDMMKGAEAQGGVQKWLDALNAEAEDD